MNIAKKVCKDKYFCNVSMPSEDIKILQFNQYKKSDEAPLIIYADLKYTIEKIDGCKTNPVNSSTAKLSEHIPLDFSMTTISSFKHDVHRGKDCVKKFCESLRERALEMIDFKNKKKSC